MDHKRSCKHTHIHTHTHTHTHTHLFSHSWSRRLALAPAGVLATAAVGRVCVCTGEHMLPHAQQRARHEEAFLF